MKALCAVVYLEHDVKAFSVTRAQIDTLEKMCPQIHFTQCDSDEMLLQILPGTDILITWKFKAAWYASAPRLKAIYTPAAGSDRIAFDTTHPAQVINGSFHGRIMAETLLGMILFMNRRFGSLINNKESRIYDRNILSATPVLHGQHVCIIGYGHIGKVAARILKAFNCTITGVKRTLSDSAMGDADRIVTFDKLYDVLGSADHTVTILPNNETTDHCITAAHFAAMKRSAFYYNIGRGNCVSETVLIDAIEKGLIAGAGLDVFETEPLPQSSRLWELPQVFIMPHAAAICKQYLDFYFEELAGKIQTIVA